MESTPILRTGRAIPILIVLSITLLLLQVPDVRAQCSKTDSCSCSFKNGSIIDLKALGNTDGTARFPDTEASDNFLYSYNPCFDFSDGDNCQNVAMCQKGIADHYDLGDQSSALFITAEDGNLIIEYSGVTGGTTRTSKVKLLCAQGDTQFTANGETAPESTIYEFDLKSVECCPKAGGGSGLSTGTILCITFLCLVTVYLVGGILYQKFVKHEEGLDLIPHKEFWMSLPGLIKDGFLFAISPCYKSSMSPSYERI